MAKRLSTINLQDVRIRDAFWNKYTGLVTKEVIPYQWETLNDRVADAAPSHCIENFKIAAGMAEGEFYGEVFQDSDVAKWLEAVAYSLSYEPNPELEKTADEVIEIIAKAQQPDGYLDTCFILKYPDKKWANLREGHELYCAGHMTEAAVAYYKVTGKDALLNVCRKLCDLICEVFHTPEYANAVPGHEEIELALVRLYEVTGEERYLSMAKDFIDRRGQVPNALIEESDNPRWFPVWPALSAFLPGYEQADIPVRMQKKAQGHAVRAVYLYCAMADLAAYYKDETLLTACETLWENIVTKQMYVTGGIGASGHLERFTTDYHLPNESNYSESCASIGLALFARRMAQATGDAKYMETAETALYNTVLSGIAMDGKSFFYVNPLAVWPPACLPDTSLAHVKPVRQKWFGCACCPPNIARTLASLGEYCYFTDHSGEKGDTLYVNLFVAGDAQFTLDGAPFTLTQETSFPFGTSVRFSVKRGAQTDGPRRGTIAIRIPSYVESPLLSLNGHDCEYRMEKGYALIERSWDESGDGDELLLSFSMPARFVRANPNVRADEGRVALVKGPLVYCLEQIDNGENLEQYLVDTTKPLTEVFEKDTLGGSLVIHAAGFAQKLEGFDDKALYGTGRVTLEPARLTFVPYCYWDNRVPGEMQVWVREKI
ncbi:MAG: glycoside hydrolase family 127 protein [Eubacteriales bacterium]|nr:glycoside hydrolase family 127 protein [Eubacteriales bacterium]